MTDGGPKIVLDRETFKVLASDTRLDILKSLDARQKTVTELSRELDLNKATVFEHLEKLQQADLVNKLEDDRKWVYYQLTWKARRLLHPEAITIALLLSSSLGAVLTAILTFWIYWKGRLVERAVGDDFESSGAKTTTESGAAAASDSSRGALFYDPAPEIMTELVRDPTLLYAGLALATLAVLLVAAAAMVRQRARAAA